MSTIQLSKSNGLEFGQISWRYYHKIKKKAMEQEFSWSGFLVSMSIAFFIVVITAYSLTLLHTSFKNAQLEQTINQQIYSLEVSQEASEKHYIQADIIDISKINSANFSSFI